MATDEPPIIVQLLSLFLQVLPFVMIWGRFLCIVWTESITPRLIPRRTIEQEAKEIMATFPDPLREVTARCERVWHAEESWKAVYWRRVQTVIRRRMEGA